MAVLTPLYLQLLELLICGSFLQSEYAYYSLKEV